MPSSRHALAARPHPAVADERKQIHDVCADKPLESIDHLGNSGNVVSDDGKEFVRGVQLLADPDACGRQSLGYDSESISSMTHLIDGKRDLVLKVPLQYHVSHLQNHGL